jgi:hypothetical protein
MSPAGHKKNICVHPWCERSIFLSNTHVINACTRRLDAFGLVYSNTWLSLPGHLPYTTGQKADV